MSSEVPVSVLVVDDDKRWLVGGRRICKCVGCVNLQADKTLMGAQGEKQAHAGLLNTTGVGVGQFELWGSTRGAVATIAWLPSSIAFDAVVPVLSDEDDRIFWCVDRGAIHFLFRHGIKLLEFCGLPIVPVGELSKFAASKTSKTLFFCRAMRRRVEGTKQ